MAAPASVAEFVEVVRKSGLVPDDQLQAEAARFKAASGPQTVDHIASALVRAGLLTRFQSKQMKIGRYKRFEIAGKYRLLELLGVGGMGAVYLCEHMFMKRLVALKVLPVEKLEDPSALHRFYREARAVAALDHPNIVRAYDIDKFEQLHFLVMEYVDGMSIQELVARHGALDPLRAANYVAQAAHGLHHAHELGMVHRDVKPGNLLLERTGVVKILDMGLARFFDHKSDNVTERFDNNCVLGTADYLAPEQAISNVVDIRADIYALGGSLYYMLTGSLPFPEGTIAHKLLCHQSDDPKPVAEYRKDVPPGLLAILHKMMRKDPAERYQTPAELFDALAPWTDGEATPPPVREMPELCPAVLALAGHAGEKIGTTRLTLAGARSGGSRHGGGGPSSHPGFPLGPTTPPPTSEAMLATATAPTTLPIPSIPVLRPDDKGGFLTASQVEFPISPEVRQAQPTSSIPLPDKAGRLWILVGLLAGLGIALAFAVLALVVWLLAK
jgi:serine/threonine protein kinase